MNALIIGRVIAGIGGAGMYLGNLNLITINTSPRERPMYQGGLGVVWGTGTILGPVIGGAFADSGATWRWAFYINLVIFGVMGWSLLLLPPFQPQPGVSAFTKLKQLDWVGAVLNAGIYVSFVLALTFGGSAWAWNSGRTIGTFVACLVTLIVFAVQQCFAIFTTPTQRLFPVEFLKSRSMILLHIATACAATALFVPVFYIPLLFQFVRGDSGLESAVRLLPFILLLIVFIMGQGIVMPLVGYYLPFFVWAGVFMIIGSALMYTVTSTTSASAIYGFSVLIAIGAGVTSQAAYSIAPAKVQPHQIAAAIGYINVAQIGGVVIALTISGAVFQNVAFNKLSHVLSGMGFTADDIRSAIAGSQSTLFEHLPTALRTEAIEAIVQAISKTYALVIAGGALALVTSVFLKWEKLFMEMGAGGA
jgi:MFS family permease